MANCFKKKIVFHYRELLTPPVSVKNSKLFLFFLSETPPLVKYIVRRN